MQISPVSGPLFISTVRDTLFYRCYFDLFIFSPQKCLTTRKRAAQSRSTHTLMNILVLANFPDTCHIALSSGTPLLLCRSWQTPLGGWAVMKVVLNCVRRLQHPGGFLARLLRKEGCLHSALLYSFSPHLLCLLLVPTPYRRLCDFESPPSTEHCLFRGPLRSFDFVVDFDFGNDPDHYAWLLQLLVGYHVVDSSHSEIHCALGLNLEPGWVDFRQLSNPHPR